MDLKTIAEQVHSNSIDKGWWTTNFNILEKLALIHSEVSEALEEYRNPDNTDFSKVKYDKSGKVPEGFAIELADIIIRTLDLAVHLHINIEQVVLEKMSYNSTRPYRHGGKRA